MFIGFLRKIEIHRSPWKAFAALTAMVGVADAMSTFFLTGHLFSTVSPVVYLIDVAIMAPMFLMLVYAPWKRELEEQIESEKRAKAAERNAREEREEISAILQSASDGIHILDMDGRLVRFNETFAKMLGYESQEMNGFSVWDWDATWTRDELRDRIREMMYQSNLFETKFKKKDGETVDVEINAIGGMIGEMPLMVCSARDITFRKQIEAEILASRDRYMLLVENVGEGIVYVDLNENFTFANSEAEQILGIPPGESLLGRNFFEFMAEEQAAVVREQTASRILGQKSSYELKIRQPNGAMRIVLVTATPHKDGTGKVVGALGVFRDITTSRLLEQEQQELREQLLESQKVESLGRLAGGVAHEVNNVLGSVMNSASLLKKLAGDNRDNQEQEQIVLIQKACVRGRDVVKSLLYFAKKQLDPPKPFDVNRVVCDLVNFLSSTTLKRIAVTAQTGDIIGRIYGDASVVGQALMNICVNAIDAMSDGGSLTVVTRQLSDSRIVVSVKDTGIGMDEPTRKRALEPFFTTKGENNGMGKGSGLGLTMAHCVVAGHSGSLDIQSTPGVGTEVIMIFPAVIGEEYLERASNVQGESSASGAPDQHGLKILLVDDDELIRASTCPLLEALGYKVEQSDSGKAALERFKQGQEYDLVILDMRMPGMDGMQTLKAIQILRPGQPTLIASGYADYDLTRETGHMEHVTFIAKPYTLDEVQRMIESMKPHIEALHSA